jgi:hypothetical protein
MFSFPPFSSFPYIIDPPDITPFSPATDNRHEAVLFLHFTSHRAGKMSPSLGKRNFLLESPSGRRMEDSMGGRLFPPHLRIAQRRADRETQLACWQFCELM